MKKILIVTASFLLGLNVLTVHSANLSQAEQLCNQATESQKQAARAAGYNVDAMCASLRQDQKVASEVTRIEEGQILPREIVDYPSAVQPQSVVTTSQVDASQDEELKKFGYELFAGVPTTFAPSSNIPVPSDYIVGPGDSLNVLLFGKINQSYQLTVDRNGSIQFPELGPINVAGLSYNNMQEMLTQRISEQIIGVQSNITMGELRSMQVFVLGEAFKPGSYTVSSMATITHALFVSGGIKDIGSLRNIQLKRNGKLVSTLDLYELLLKGDTRNDRRLQSGDVIYIPTVKKTASVAGEVVRPAIYEIKNERNLKELLALSGGLLATAQLKDSIVNRIDSNGAKTVINANLLSSSGKNIKIRNGDVLKIFPVLEKQENIVTLEGHVYRAGKKAWNKNMKISQLIPDATMLKPNANIDFVLVVREQAPIGELKTFKVDLRNILKGNNLAKDFVLQARDRVIVLSNSLDKEELGNLLAANDKKTENKLTKRQIEYNVRNKNILQVIKSLKSQASYEKPGQLVSISGAAKFPGSYPLVEGMNIKDLIQFAGGFTESAYTINAEITRKDLTDPSKADTIHMDIDLQQEFLGNVQFKLKPHDNLIIKVTPEYRDVATVIVSGEVKFPGAYKIRRGETLLELIKRVGGFSEFAHVKAAVFSREELRKREQLELTKLKGRLKQELTSQRISKESITNETADYSALNSLVDVIDDTEPTGRLVIDLPKIISQSAQDIVLQDGDKLLIPAYREEVTVLGEVQIPTSHVFNEIFDFDDYIQRSGGEKQSANTDSIYIVKANGSLMLPNKNSWLNHDDYRIEAGDTIVVPVDTQRVDKLELWTRVSQIVYQLALGAAAIKSF